MQAQDESKIRKRIIPIRYRTPSRERIFLIVAQLQDAVGNWMVPTITVSDRIPQIIESGRFAKDLGDAFTNASYFFEQWMLDVMSVDADNNKRTDSGVENE